MDATAEAGSSDRLVLPPSLLPTEFEAEAASAAGQLFLLCAPPPPLELVPAVPDGAGLTLTVRFAKKKLTVELPKGATGSQLRAKIRRSELAVPMELQEFVFKGRRLRADGGALADEGVPPGATLLLKRLSAGPMAQGRSVAGGVLSYDAAEGTCHLPAALASRLGLSGVDSTVQLRRVTLPAATAVSIRVDDPGPFDLDDPAACEELRKCGESFLGRPPDRGGFASLSEQLQLSFDASGGVVKVTVTRVEPPSPHKAVSLTAGFGGDVTLSIDITSASPRRAAAREEAAEEAEDEAEDGAFELVPDIIDHKFLGSDLHPGGAALAKAQRVLQKQFAKDPEPGIYIRWCEQRSDLLRVLVAGPANTPYHGGLFVFDLQLPPNFPDVPPRCHFHSLGAPHRLNPNLYAHDPGQPGAPDKRDAATFAAHSQSSCGLTACIAVCCVQVEQPRTARSA